MPADTNFRPRTERLEPREVPTAAALFAVGGGPGGPPRVKVFDTTTGVVVGDFLAYEPTFTGGVTAALGDVNNDGFADLVVGAGVGGGPRVRVFNGLAFRTGVIFPGIVPAPRDGTSFMPDTDVIADFFAYEDTQRGGSFVAVGNFAGTAYGDIVIGAGPGGGPRVRVLDGEQVARQGRQFTGDRLGDTVANFFAYESSFRNGVVVAASPPLFGASYSDLVVAPGLGGGPRVRVLDGTQLAAQRLGYTSVGFGDGLADFFVGDANSRAGLYVTSADFNSDGVADVAIGSGPGQLGSVVIYNGANIRSRRGAFTGGLAGDILDGFDVSPAADATAGPTSYSNGVTVGAALDPGGISRGLLMIGFGGQGRFGRAQLIRFQTGSGFLTRQVSFDVPFDPNFAGGVFVSN